MTLLRILNSSNALVGMGLTPSVPQLKWGADPNVSYPAPAGAIYVSTTGSDSSGNGTHASPYRTIKKGLASTPANGTCVVRGGEYHEGGTYPNLGAGPVVGANGVTLQRYLNEEVWLDGSVVVTNWSSYDSNKYRAPFAQTLDRAPSQVRGEQLSALYGSFVVAEFPIAHWPEMLLLDGVQQKQVQNLSDVVSGTFTSDGVGTFFVEGFKPNSSGINVNAFTSVAYVIGTNPSGKELRIAEYGRSMGTNASNFSLKGIGIRRYCQSLPDFGGLYIGTGENFTMENVTIKDMSDLGMNYSGKGVVMRNNTFDTCGRGGINATGDNSLIEWNYFTKTNNRRFNYGPSGGAIKLHTTWDGIMRYNWFEDNRGHGIWYDVPCYRNTIHGNVFIDTYGAAILYEISARALIVDNIIIDNGIHSTDISVRRSYNSPGISMISSTNCVVWHNTIINADVSVGYGEGYRKPLNDDGVSWRTTSQWGPVFAQDLNRPDSFYQARGWDDRWQFYREEMTWNSTGLSFGNNAIIGSVNYNSVQSSLMRFYDGERNYKSTIDFGPFPYSNLFARTDSNTPVRFVNGWKPVNPGSSGTGLAYFNLTANASDGTPSWRTIMQDNMSTLYTGNAVADKYKGRLTSAALLALPAVSTPPPEVAALLAVSIFTPQRVGAGYLKD